MPNFPIDYWVTSLLEQLLMIIQLDYFRILPNLSPAHRNIHIHVITLKQNTEESYKNVTILGWTIFANNCLYTSAKVWCHYGQY